MNKMDVLMKMLGDEKAKSRKSEPMEAKCCKCGAECAKCEESYDDDDK